MGKFRGALPAKEQLVEMFKKYGYDTSGTDNEKQYSQLIRAFQLHFRPCNYSGQMDIETAAILYALVEKYKN